MFNGVGFALLILSGYLKMEGGEGGFKQTAIIGP